MIRLTTFDAKLKTYTYLNDKLLSLPTIQANSSQCNSEQNVSQQNQLDLFDMMVTNQPVTMGVNSDPAYATYENEREISRNQNKYPKISQMAWKYLYIAATSALSERMFSASGHLTSDKRSRLTPDNANILLFLNKNS